MKTMKKTSFFVFIIGLMISFGGFSQTTEVWVKQQLLIGQTVGNVNDSGFGGYSILMPEVIQFNEGYRMFYNLTTPDSFQIRYADSPDCLEWTDGGVVLKSDTSKDTIANHRWVIGGASIIHSDSGYYRMYYRCSEYYSGIPKYEIRSAYSSDGTHFSDEGIRIEIYPYDSLSPVKLAGHGKFFVNSSGGITGIFSGNPKNTNDPSDLYITTSTDGLHFSNFINKYADYHDPAIVKKDGQYILYARHLKDKFGKAVSADGIHWPEQLDSVSFVDSAGTTIEAMGDLGAIRMPNNEIWIFSNYSSTGGASTDIALFRLSNSQNIKNNIINNKTFVYPNPAHNQIIIENKEAFSGKIQILDITGKTVKQIIANKKLLQTIDINNLQSGIYFLQLQRNDTIETIKFIKQ